MRDDTTRSAFPVGDCHVGDCARPVDHAGRHGARTPGESRVAEQRARERGPAVPARDEPDWDALYREHAARTI